MKNIERFNDTRVKEKILSVLKGGDILFIVPPFAYINYPVFSLHVLQSVAEENGYKTEILYLNALLSPYIDRDVAKIVNFPTTSWKMMGERFFTRKAYGLPPLGRTPENCMNETMSVQGNMNGHVKTYYEFEAFDLDTYKKIEATCILFVDIVAPLIASLRYKIIGCSTCFGQTNANIALLKGIKQVHSDIITLIGGANCEGDMAEGIASLSDSIDYIFSGESELSLSKFLQGYSRGRLPSERIIWGEPLKDLDSLSLPDYDAFFKQLDTFMGPERPKEIAIFYETSRGCWWGRKQKCSFCAVTNVQFRKKTAKKVLEDLEQLKKRYPSRRIFMTDNIMPISFYKELIPGLSQKKNLHMQYQYQIKANLKLKQLIRLKSAKIDILTPGIESLSTGLLKLANKGLKARENLCLLRNARSVGINIVWHFLWGFPGDKVIYYEEMLALLPLLRHLQPPLSITHVQLERFSLYFQNPSDYQISNLRPLALYKDIYPGRAKIDKLAFYFTGDYSCESHRHPELIQEIIKEWKLWKKMWEKSRLVMVPFMDFYLIFDKRDINGKTRKHILEYQQAREIMTACVYKKSGTLKWALEEKLGTVVDSWYVPLVTASPQLLLEFEKELNMEGKILC